MNGWEVVQAGVFIDGQEYVALFKEVEGYEDRRALCHLARKPVTPAGMQRALDQHERTAREEWDED